MKQVSDIDNKHFKMIRQNITSMVLCASMVYDKEGVVVLDIAPQVHAGAKKFFTKATVKTLDIDKDSSADYICDLADANIVPDETFDVIFCTEVLEHTNDPFACAETLRRMLKPNGICYVSTPFNFRIHNPLPDNWRFTEHGLRILFKNFSNVTVTPLEDVDRFLMPIQYTTVLIK